uniref:Uncharacterized protein n=1 Tax=viral metagenome TaxID=1070528 RepID=A0A6M3IXK8_9ZZZZ
MATTQQPTTGHVQHTEVYGEDAAGLPRAVSVTDDGHLAIAATVADKVTVVPETDSGVSGRLPTDVSLTIAVGPPAKTISAHPLRGGVSVIGAVGAAAAVSATGKVVTLTAKNDGTTTVTAMIALIAASSTVAPLLAISGTGADLFDATWSVAETPLWAAGTIPANLMCALGSDGYNWPVETDNTGGIKTSDSSLNHGEGDTVPPLRVIRKGTRYNGAAAGNAVVTGAGTCLQINVAASTAGTVLVYDALTATGTPIATIRCPINDTREVSPVCGMGTGLTVAFADLFAGTWGITFKAD